MKYKDLKKKPWFKFMSNKYVLLLTVFLIWMLFLDSNSWLIHRELNQEIDEVEANKLYYQNEIKKDRQILKELEDSIEIERFARETYFMKRPHEDIYIIEYEDSLNTDKDE
ncbi:septum formation initiator family protein [Psychroflexus sp. YR1-1]|uniref:Septum formation initiator family protein n=1 Tax=Psychroflexus aurantiacus TaxID=2709310 RepID=A0A6B3R0W9_9FLAO|nr:septum formation initiator family protein [Psychroflexus aurantiacus]NEV94219.1 septum formation initiator family protein [Psychroflexus aurantiacus]